MATTDATGQQLAPGTTLSPPPAMPTQVAALSLQPFTSGKNKSKEKSKETHTCFACGEPGHLAAKCPKKEKRVSFAPSVKGGKSGGSGGAEGTKSWK